jgi:hypothetical protein
MLHVWKKKRIHGELWWESQKERPLGRLRLSWRTILRLIFEKNDGLEWTGLIWHRIGISG